MGTKKMIWENLKKNSPFLLFNEEGGRFKYPTKFEWLPIIYLVCSAIYITVAYWQEFVKADTVKSVILFLFPLTAIIFFRFVNLKRVDYRKSFLSIFKNSKFYLSHLIDTLFFIWCYIFISNLIGEEDLVGQLVISPYFIGLIINAFKVFGMNIVGAMVLVIVIFITGLPNTDWWVFYALIFAFINLLVSEEAYYLFAPKRSKAEKWVKRQLYKRKLQISALLMFLYPYIRLTEKLSYPSPLPKLKCNPDKWDQIWHWANYTLTLALNRLLIINYFIYILIGVGFVAMIILLVVANRNPEKNFIRGIELFCKRCWRDTKKKFWAIMLGIKS